MLVLDTDVMVDVLRGHRAAVDWLGSAEDEELILPGLVLMELVNGCRDGVRSSECFRLPECSQSAGHGRLTVNGP